MAQAVRKRTIVRIRFGGVFAVACNLPMRTISDNMHFGMFRRVYLGLICTWHEVHYLNQYHNQQQDRQGRKKGL